MPLCRERNKMAQKKTKAAAVMLALALSLPTSLLAASAKTAEKQLEANARSYALEDLTYTKNEIGLRPVSQRNIYTYSKKNITYGTLGKSGSARMVNGDAYISLRAFAGAIGASYSYSSSTAVIKQGASILTVTDGAYTMYINGRPIFALSNSVKMSDGELYAPLASVAKAFRMTVQSKRTSITVSGKGAPLAAKAPYSSDEVFWLARIIEAESGGEPLLGKIAVGNIVLNRVKSPLYPNTIYGVIFDRKYGVQFSPVQDGRIYNTPSYQSTLAAKICLEGFKISDDALFFLAPATASSLWIAKNREYVFSIGHHDFYL